MRAKLLTFLVPFALAGSLAHADPPSYVLQAATLETSSGSLVGFTAYSTSDVSRVNNEKNKGRRAKDWVNYPSTDEEIIRFLKGTYSLNFYATIVKVAYPREMIVTTIPIRKVRGEDIREIRLSSHPLNGFTWYGIDVPPFSRPM